MKKTLSIIIPVFNEDKTIKKLLKKVSRVRLPDGMDKEIIVIDDGSKDNSKFKIQNSKIHKTIRFFSHKRNLGKGASVRTGIKNATGDYLIIQDADLEYNPDDYQKLLQPILKKQAKIVFGTRLQNYPLKLWGKNKTVLPWHLIANRFLTTLTNFLYGSNLTDMETGYKLFTREIIKKLDLKSSGFEIEPEITVKTLNLGYNIMEVPIKTKPRGYDQGKKINWRDGFKAVFTLVKYRFYE